MFQKMMLGLALGSAFVLGCGSSPPATNDLAVALDLSAAADMTTVQDMTTTGDLAPMVVTVGNGGNNFNPQTVTIKVGQAVKWVWASAGHNVVSGTAGTPDNKFCSPSNAATCDATGSPTSAIGANYTRTFPTAGTFPYFCRPHSGVMTGTVTVEQ